MVDDIAERGWSVNPGFLQGEELDGLIVEASRLQKQGVFRAAGIGRGEVAVSRPEIRGDHILWLDPSHPGPAQTGIFLIWERLRNELNRELFLGLVSLEAHYACYPAGAGYKRHRDRFSDADERVISLVLYLNADWKPEMGGQLRLHLPEGPVDVEPRAGTLALFRSDTIYHEVLPAAAPRFSMAGWFRRRPL